MYKWLQMKLENKCKISTHFFSSTEKRQPVSCMSKERILFRNHGGVEPGVPLTLSQSICVHHLYILKVDCQLNDSLFCMSRKHFVPFSGCMNATLSQILSKQISYLKHHLRSTGVSQRRISALRKEEQYFSHSVALDFKRVFRFGD